MAILLVILPWLGAMSSAGLTIVAIGLLAIVLMASIGLVVFGKPAVSRLPLAFVSVLLVLVFAAFQLLPLPESLLKVVSPNQQKLREDLGWLPASEAPSKIGTSHVTNVSSNEIGIPSSVLDPAQNAKSGYPLSMAPSATRQFMTMLLLGASAFVGGSILAAWEGSGVWLIAAVVMGGGSWGLLVLVFRSFDLVFRASPFVEGVIDRFSSAGLIGYLLIAFGCGIAMLIVSIRRARSENKTRDRVLDTPVEGRQTDAGRIPESYVHERIHNSNLCDELGVASQFCMRSMRSTRFVVAVVALIAIAATICSADTVMSRYADLTDSIEGDQRILTHEFMQSESLPWYEGVGLGTVTTRIGNRSSNNAVRLEALQNNQWSNLILEGGLGFMALSLIALAWLCSQAVLLWGYAIHDADRIIALALLISFGAFVSVGILTPNLIGTESLIPVSGLAGATTICAARAMSNRKNGDQVSGPDRGFLNRFAYIPKPISGLIATSLLFGALMISGPAYSDFRFQLVENEASRLLEQGISADVARVDSAIEEISSLESKSNREEVSRLLGELYVLRYRLTKAEVIERSLAIHDIEVSPTDAYKRASLTGLYRDVHKAFLEHGEEGLAAKRSDPAVRGYLVPAIECFRNARLHCPLVAQDHLRLAQLSFLYESPDRNEVHLQRALRIGKGQKTIVESAALIQAQNATNQQSSKSIKDTCEHSLKIAAAHLNIGPTLFSSSGIVVSTPCHGAHDSTQLHHRFEHFEVGMIRQSSTIGSGFSSSPQSNHSGITKSPFHSVSSTASSFPSIPGWCRLRVPAFARIALERHTIDLRRSVIPFGIDLTAYGASHRPRKQRSRDQVAQTMSRSSGLQETLGMCKHAAPKHIGPKHIGRTHIGRTHRSQNVVSDFAKHLSHLHPNISSVIESRVPSIMESTQSQSQLRYSPGKPETHTVESLQKSPSLENSIRIARATCN